MRYVYIFLSLNIILTYLIRYNTQNILICGLTPGPTELTGDELQAGVLKAYVDDLIRLFEEGILVKTPKYTEGKGLTYYS